MSSSIDLNSSQTLRSSGMQVRVIKRYANRKLYDTVRSCYVTLDDISKMVRSDENVMVIDNNSKNDITATTLTQIIFDAEKRAKAHTPLSTLREIIRDGDGSISNYLVKTGAISKDQLESHEVPSAPSFAKIVERQTFDQRVAQAASIVSSDSNLKVAVASIKALPELIESEVETTRRNQARGNASVPT